MSLYRTLNPATGEFVREYPCEDERAVEQTLAAADAAFRAWRRSEFAERRALLQALADLLDAEAETHALTITEEMGKTFRSAIAEVAKSASTCRWYAEQGEELLASEQVTMPQSAAEVRYEPIGTVLAVMPWNFPFWQVTRFLAPALMAGNAVILKHAPNTPASALALVDLLDRAGAPPGLFQNLFIDNEQVRRLIQDTRIAAVTLTGSERAGEAVGGAAGAALKRCVLELGGSDPLIVMPSGDFEAAVRAAVFARNQNNGQSCVCAKRILVDRSLHERFRDSFVDAVGNLRLGDPLLDETDVGPLATFEARARLAKQVERAAAEGGVVLIGGRAPDLSGAFYLPTVIEAPPRGASIRQEELFGPVALLFAFDDIDEAIAIANETPFGLGSSVWTTDADEQAEFAERLECGMTFFNSITASDPRLPFGGIKRSGFGRELGRWGMLEFLNVRTVVAAR